MKVDLHLFKRYKAAISNKDLKKTLIMVKIKAFVTFCNQIRFWWSENSWSITIDKKYHSLLDYVTKHLFIEDVT